MKDEARGGIPTAMTFPRFDSTAFVAAHIEMAWLLALKFDGKGGLAAMQIPLGNDGEEALP